MTEMAKIQNTESGVLFNPPWGEGFLGPFHFFHISAIPPFRRFLQNGGMTEMAEIQNTESEVLFNPPWGEGFWGPFHFLAISAIPPFRHFAEAVGR